MFCRRTNKQRLAVIREMRIIEFLLCVICLLVILLEHPSFVIRSEAIISLTVLYMAVTFLDIIFIYKWFPIGWFIFSMTGALFFFACVGLSFYVDHDALAYIVLVGITAVVFLLDGFCTLKEQVLNSYHKHITSGQIFTLNDCNYEYEKNLLRSNRRHATSSDERQDSRSSGCSRRETNTIDEEKSASSWGGDDVQGMSVKERSSEGSRSRKIRNGRSEMVLSRYGKNLQVRRSIRHIHAKRQAFKAVAPSYGGTFHVSRDTAPMACPFTNLQEVPQNENYEEQVWRNDFRKSSRAVQSAVLRSAEEVNLTPLRSPFSATKYRSSPAENRNDFGRN